MKVFFEWDKGNDTKNYTKHGVSRLEAESLFQDLQRLDFDDPFGARPERRYVTIARSNRPRILLAAWTLRGSQMRIISVRPASRKERKLYEEKNGKGEKGT